MSNTPQDSGIPVLTEVIVTPPRVASTPASPVEAPAAWQAVPPPAPAPAHTPTPAPQYNFSPNQSFAPIPPFFTAPAAPNAPAEYVADIPVLQVEIEVPPAPVEHAPISGWLDEEWTRMEQKISERVLTQLLSRIDTVLEERMQEVLSTSLQRAVEEIKQGLHQTLGEVVSDAVAQEINNLHFSKNKNF